MNEDRTFKFELTRHQVHGIADALNAKSATYRRAANDLIYNFGDTRDALNRAADHMSNQADDLIRTMQSQE